MYKLTWLALMAVAASAQTQVDLKIQSKSVDFSGANPTKPMATGTALPATCSSGQMFFITTAIAGQNLYGCTAANTWTLEAGGSGGGGGGGGTGVTVESAGAAVGTSATLDFTTGIGALYAISILGGGVASIQATADTSVLESLARAQSGSLLLCASASGSSTAYACALNPTLSAYSAGMVLHWKPDVSGAGGPTTMNVDTLGTVSLKLADGATDPGSGDVVAGRLYGMWFDGTVFRLAGAIFPAGVLGEPLPTCGAAVRGRLWFVAGGTGVKDSLSVCAKDATNAYLWRPLY
ncbi:MAG TPA: hypothetical protein VGG72_03820 [Bryobacteraceae bacterium]|jgi:hypothetical protein